MLSKGRAGWKKCDKMCCEHGEPFKELQNRDPTGPPLDYMKQHGVFKAKKTNRYDFSHFYHVELSGDLPPFPSPCKPATHGMLKEPLRAAWALGHPNLLMAFARDSATVVCFLQELHNKGSLKHLPLEPKSDTDSKMVKMLSFCLFCLYNGSNDISYINHIVGRHYSTAYGCRKCLKEVFLLGQQLKVHLRVCMGFPKGDTPSSSDKEPAPQGVQESSQDSLCCSQHPKKKSGLCQGAQLSLQGSQVSQEVQASERGYIQEGEVGQEQDGQAQLQKVPQEIDLCHLRTSAVHHFSNACQKWCGSPPGTVVFSHSF